MANQSVTNAMLSVSGLYKMFLHLISHLARCQVHISAV